MSSDAFFLSFIPRGRATLDVRRRDDAPQTQQLSRWRAKVREAAVAKRVPIRRNVA